MRAALTFVPRLRARVDANLVLVFPELPPAERREIRDAMTNSVGRTLVELLDVPALQRRAPWSEPSGPGWEALRQTRDEGCGALLVSGHFGQWEAVRAALKARGIECGAIYRPLRDPHLERVWRANLEQGGRPMVGRDQAGLREMIRHLRAGGVAAVLLDQYVKRGVEIDFLGHPAPSGTTIAELALKLKIPMIPVYGIRAPDGAGVALHFEAPIPHTTPLAMTQAAADSLAARVRAYPGQYYWLHQRWVKRL